MQHAQELHFIPQFPVPYLPVIVHLGADPFAGGEEIFCHIHFARHIFFGHLFSILVDKGKRLYCTYRVRFLLPKAGYDLRKDKIKDKHQRRKKSRVKPPLFGHIRQFIQQS